jgi:hypothetical protein
MACTINGVRRPQHGGNGPHDLLAAIDAVGQSHGVSQASAVPISTLAAMKTISAR